MGGRRIERATEREGGEGLLVQEAAVGVAGTEGGREGACEGLKRGCVCGGAHRSRVVVGEAGPGEEQHRGQELPALRQKHNDLFSHFPNAHGQASSWILRAHISAVMGIGAVRRGLL